MANDGDYGAGDKNGSNQPVTCAQCRVIRGTIVSRGRQRSLDRLSLSYQFLLLLLLWENHIMCDLSFT